jgi:ABC-type bacteriocin/lantibiotic exporter with double-glycine peptidase domain
MNTLCPLQHHSNWSELDSYIRIQEIQQMFVHKSICRPICVYTYVALCYCIYMNYVNGTHTLVTVAMRGFSCIWFSLLMVQLSRNIQEKILCENRTHRVTSNSFRWTYISKWEPKLRWSRGSLLAFGTQVRGFAPGRSRQIFRAK